MVGFAWWWDFTNFLILLYTFSASATNGGGQSWLGKQVNSLLQSPLSAARAVTHWPMASLCWQESALSLWPSVENHHSSRVEEWGESRGAVLPLKEPSVWALACSQAAAAAAETCQTWYTLHKLWASNPQVQSLVIPEWHLVDDHAVNQWKHNLLWASHKDFKPETEIGLWPQSRHIKKQREEEGTILP